MSPFPTGSLSCAVTMEIVTVACLAARVAAGPLVTMTSTLRRTSSAARPRSRSALPSANRHSITMFFPSTYPSSRRPCRNASIRTAIVEGESLLRYPTRGTFTGCCALAEIVGRKIMVSDQKSIFPVIEFIPDFLLTPSASRLTPIESPDPLSPAHSAEPFDFRFPILDFRLFGHRMTLSALANTLGGIVNPICFAVFRLITNSNFLGCSTGRSAGLAPLRILST